MYDNKVKIIFLRNPFKPSDVDISYREYLAGETVDYYVKGLMLEGYAVSVNGNRSEATHLINPCDCIAVCATVGKGGKNILGTIAMIALAGFAGSVAGGLWSASPFMSGIYATAIMSIGGALINSIFPPPTPDYGKANAAEDPTYGWGGQSPIIAQGQPLAITYGTVRTKGSVVSRHVFYEGKNQLLSMVLVGGEGAVNEITDIRINNNPIANYTNANVEMRYGYNDQDRFIDPVFSRDYDDKQLSYVLTKGGDWSTDITEGDGGEGLEVVYSFPQGLCKINDEGNVENAWVELISEYRKEGENEWKVLEKKRVDEKIRNSFSVTSKIMDIPIGRYFVRCRCVDKSGTSDRDINTVAWIQLTHVIYADFARPNKVVIGVRVLATDQLSGGIPEVSWLQSRSAVRVYDSDLKLYVDKPANNPAWACYDIVHRCRNMRNTQTGVMEDVVFGKAKERMDYLAFKRWAEYCASQNIAFNFLFSSVYDLWSALKIPETVGRGKVLLRGTTYSCVCDAPSTPVQLFSLGNIMAGGFKMSYLPKKDRANAIDISFSNRDKDYTNDPITLYGDNYDSSSDSQNPSQVSLQGCVDYRQACLQGKYYLRLNKYLLRTVSFDADIDAIACQVGDVILVRHDVLNLDAESEETGSGRIVSATANSVKLDREIKMQGGKNYRVCIQTKKGNIIYRDVVYSTTRTDIVSLTTPLDAIPERFDLYSFGDIYEVTRPFRVTAISRSGELKRTITALEYFDEIYIDDGEIPARYRDKSKADSWGKTPPMITNVRCKTNTDDELLITHDESDILYFKEYRYYVEEVETI